jgi:hypothetical protein
VVVGYSTMNQHGRAATAPAPGDWAIRDTGSASYLSAVTFGAGRFVAVGYGGVAQSSTDGVEWSPTAAAGGVGWLFKIIHKAEIFVAVGERTSITTSPDGLTWKRRHTALGNVLHGVAYGGGTFVAVGGSPHPAVRPGKRDRRRAATHNPAQQGDDFQFQFATEPGQAYVVQESADLKSGHPWRPSRRRRIHALGGAIHPRRGRFTGWSSREPEHGYSSAGSPIEGSVLLPSSG